MSLFKGRKITAEIYGESHADKIGIRVTGFPEFAFSPEKLKEFIERRKPSLSVFSTKRREPDEPRFYRADGSEITDNFPNGFARLKTRTEKAATITSFTESPVLRTRIMRGI